MIRVLYVYLAHTYVNVSNYDLCVYIIFAIHTDSNSFRAVRREYKSSDSDEGQQTTRYDQIYDIVARSASYVKRKRETRIFAP